MLATVPTLPRLPVCLLPHFEIQKDAGPKTTTVTLLSDDIEIPAPHCTPALPRLTLLILVLLGRQAHPTLLLLETLSHLKTLQLQLLCLLL